MYPGRFTASPLAVAVWNGAAVARVGTGSSEVAVWTPPGVCAAAVVEEKVVLLELVVEDVVLLCPAEPRQSQLGHEEKRKPGRVRGLHKLCLPRAGWNNTESSARAKVRIVNECGVRRRERLLGWGGRAGSRTPRARRGRWPPLCSPLKAATGTQDVKQGLRTSGWTLRNSGDLRNPHEPPHELARTTSLTHRTHLEARSRRRERPMASFYNQIGRAHV